ncbi:MAG TPA: NAD(P)H-hydrate dehydratase, partial [Candidatus Eisenbacteria bacterium]|nr:NAD(P)H-hydrate dehydratase [Candidatus Eisenbacteria bacterium]
LARELFGSLGSPLVLDADGLAAFAPAPALPAAPGPRVLTPHVGEMARLTGLAPDALEARRIDAAREWARRWGCVLVLKGAPTVVADATGRACVNPTGNPGMATAGMGDVLGGAVAALLAAGLDAYDAARVAAYAHGLAGDAAARARGATGLIAGAVIEELPRALQSLRDAR